MADKELKALLKKLEGSSLTGYIPKGGESGLTIGGGFDLGQHKEEYLEGLPASLITKLTPFMGAKTLEVGGKTLTLTQDEVDKLDNFVLDKKETEFKTSFEEYVGPVSELNKNQKLALSSAYFNMGNNIFRNKETGEPTNFVNELKNSIVSKDWSAPIYNLATWHGNRKDQPKARRTTESLVMSGSIDIEGAGNVRDMFAKNKKARDAYLKGIELPLVDETARLQARYPAPPLVDETARLQARYPAPVFERVSDREVKGRVQSDNNVIGAGGADSSALASNIGANVLLENELFNRNRFG